MSTATGKIDKKQLREFHQKTLTELGVADAIFMPKMAYTPAGKSERHVAFFLSEINTKGQDVYVEFCSNLNVPEEDDRGLYRWKFNPHFEEEYEKTEPSLTTGHCRYLVPISELVKVKSYSGQESSKKTSPVDFEIDSADAPMAQMTMRDYAAIHMRKPVSAKAWLNELIIKNP